MKNLFKMEDEEQTVQQSNESQQSQPEIQPLTISCWDCFAFICLTTAKQVQLGADGEVRRRESSLQLPELKVVSKFLQKMEIGSDIVLQVLDRVHKDLVVAFRSIL